MTKKLIIGKVLDILVIYFTRSFAGMFLMLGVSLLGIEFFNFSFSYSYNEGGHQAAASISSGDIAQSAFKYPYLVGTILIGIGIYLVIKKSGQVQKKIVIAIEVRGLGDGIDTPLLGAIPRRYFGQRQSIYLDVRGLIPGNKRQVELAIRRVNTISENLIQHKSGKDRDDITLFAGGLAAVPLLFLAGTRIGSESKTHWLDWDRVKSQWISPINGEKVSSEGLFLPEISKIHDDSVVVSLAISYSIERSDLELAFPGKQIVSMEMPDLTLGKVLNEETIDEIVEAFISLVAELKRHNFKSIHLALSAPSILSMRLGTAYSIRNMPDITVYQYQREMVGNPYLWGVLMPVSEHAEGEYVDNA